MRARRHDSPLAARGFGLLLVAATILPFAFAHVDDVDGSLYAVIIRHLVEDGTPARLRGLPGLFPSFFEHPPFFFAVQAALARVFGEAALPWASGLVGVATVALAMRLSAQVPGLGGARGALLTAWVLALTESFFRYQARTRIDPSFTFLMTASIVVLFEAGPRRAWAFAGGLVSGLAVLVKGPPGWGAPLAALLMLLCVGRARDLRRAPEVALGALLLPAAALAYDHWALGGLWWHGYVESQVVASIVGARTDGHTETAYLFGSVAGRFWPGLPLVFVALLRRDRARWAMVAWALVILVGFSFAARAWWVYAMPAYVPLAVLAGAGGADLLDRFAPHRGAARLGRVTAVAALLLCVAAPWGWTAWMLEPCPLGTLPPLVVASTAPSDTVIVVGPGSTVAPVVYVAEHTRRAVVARAPEAGDRFGVFERRTPPPEGWRVVGRDRAWVFAERAGAE